MIAQPLREIIKAPATRANALSLFLLQVSFELSQCLMRIQPFCSPDLLSQPKQLVTLFE